MLLVGGKRFWDEFAQEPEPASKRSRFWLSVLCHLLIFSAFFTFTGLVLQKEMRTSDEFITALSDHVRAAVEKAVSRAKENGRSTLRPADL